MKNTLTLSLFFLVLFASACKKEPRFREIYYTAEQYNLLTQYLDLPDIPPSYDVQFPSHLQQEGLFAKNIDAGLATLGRVLFYDKNLSSDHTIACASCHRQELGFSDNVAFSRGVEDRQTTRNSYPLGSVSSFAATYDGSFNGARFFWDERAATVADQSRETFGNPREMNMTMADVVREVRAQAYYGPLFQKAFGSTDVSGDRVLAGLTAFVNALGAFHTRFDEEAIKLNNAGLSVSSPFSGFTAAENRGKALFLNHCQSCHGNTAARSRIEHACNGLDATTTDPGIGGVFNTVGEMAVFKVPTLRNVALTAPYMHDGRFATLEAVVEHYNSGIQDHPNLSSALREPSGAPKRLNLSDDDKHALVAFLQTLTDDQQRTDPRFADPFK